MAAALGPHRQSMTPTPAGNDNQQTAVTVGLVGVGTIAQTHLTVLADIPEVALAFVVDPQPDMAVSFKGTRPPHYTALTDALGQHRPALVVIATPTDTHAHLAPAVLRQSAARVLVEKPLVNRLDEVAALRALDASLDARARLWVAHHFAFSPEVTWAADLIAHRGWGPVTRITSVFHDAYITDAEHSFAAYTSSWVDSGVNQLSMLTRFVDPVRRGVLHETDGGASAWCTVEFRSDDSLGTALLRTSWQATASSKRTTLHLDRAGVEVWLDHTAVTAVATRGDTLIDCLTNDGTTPRKVAHYRPLYQSLLSDTPDPVLSFQTGARIVELLHGTTP